MGVTVSESTCRNCPMCGSFPVPPPSKGIQGQAWFSGVSVEQYEKGKFTVECGTCGHASPIFNSGGAAIDFWNSEHKETTS